MLAYPDHQLAFTVEWNFNMAFERSLENYKTMHKQTAKDKDVYEEFMSCNTLTRARKVLFGVKGKKPTHLGSSKK